MSTLRAWIEAEMLDCQAAYSLSLIGLSRLKLEHGALLTFTLETCPHKHYKLHIEYPFANLAPNPSFKTFFISHSKIMAVPNVLELATFVKIASESEYRDWFLGIVRNRRDDAEGMKFIVLLMKHGGLDVNDEEHKRYLEAFLHDLAPDVGKFLDPGTFEREEDNKSGSSTAVEEDTPKTTTTVSAVTEVVEGVTELKIGAEFVVHLDQDGDGSLVTVVTGDAAVGLGSAANNNWLRAARCHRPSCNNQSKMQFECGGKFMRDLKLFGAGGCGLGMYCSESCLLQAYREHFGRCHLSNMKHQNFEPTAYSFRCRGRLFLENGTTDRLVKSVLVDKEFTGKGLFEKCNLMMIAEEKQPVWEGWSRVYAWGRTPARDLLKLGEHEGEGYEKPLSVLLTNAEDMRHVIKTVTQLPKTFSQPITFVINEAEFHNQLRNLVITLLTLLFPGGEASELCIHIWYSARLTENMLGAIHAHISPLIHDVVTRIKSLPENPAGYSKVWKFGTSQVKATFTKREWNIIWITVNPRKDGEVNSEWAKQWASVMLPLGGSDEHKLRRGMLYNEMTDTLPLPVRYQEKTFRETGVLLPDGLSSLNMWKRNPFMFNIQGQLTNNPLASVLDGSDLVQLDAVGKKLGYPMNDLHGILFFLTRDMLKNFSKRIRTSSFVFDFKNVSVKDLPQHLGADIKFDRIEISSLVDRGLFADNGIARTAPALKLYSPLLKRITENPSAMLTALYSSAVSELRRFCATILDPQCHKDEVIDHHDNIAWFLKTNMSAHPSPEEFVQRPLSEEPFSPQKQAQFVEMRKEWLELCVAQDEKMWEMYCVLKRVYRGVAAAGLKINVYGKGEGERVVRGEKCRENWPFWLDVKGDGTCDARDHWLRFGGRMKGSERLVEFSRMSEGELGESLEGDGGALEGEKVEMVEEEEESLFVD